MKESLGKSRRAVAVLMLPKILRIYWIGSGVALYTSISGGAWAEDFVQKKKYHEINISIA
jgi:hypothetical protein